MYKPCFAICCSQNKEYQCLKKGGASEQDRYM